MKLMNFRNKVLLLATLLSASDMNCGFEMLSKRSREESALLFLFQKNIV